MPLPLCTRLAYEDLKGANVNDLTMKAMAEVEGARGDWWMKYGKVTPVPPGGQAETPPGQG